MAYLLDTNVLIEAKNRYYSFDICPGFWAWLVQANQKGLVFSIEKVADEILPSVDRLADWVEERGDGFFLKPDEAILDSLSALSAWAGSKYEATAVTTFLQAADYYLVAYAHGHKHVVVSHEVPKIGIKKVKIPEACIAMQVKCVSPFEMLRQEKARFVLPA